MSSWRERPEDFDRVRDLQILDDRWLDAALSGAPAPASSVALMANLLASTEIPDRKTRVASHRQNARRAAQLKWPC